MPSNEEFYLGRLADPQTGQVSTLPLLYDPADLTTHAVVVGMTGSGKTGLCVTMLEEAALEGIPALMIDPKGDITNTLLHFPDLLPADFQPWVNPDEARRAGLSLEQAAQKAAETWRKGLEEWGLGPGQLLALKNAAQFTVYTPGSDAGVPVNILASLKAPLIPWESNREMLREKISGTVTALLGLVGLKDIDPVRSREHILLANIFEHAWSQGKDLDLGELILQTQSPPFPKLGVFDVNTFFPEKDRFELAMLLNNILAAPSFQTWTEGQPLDIAGLLYTSDGRPRHSVFYIAHLTDAERMFFVTLLYSAIETWMRGQPGTTSLRAIVYFDEIFGYLPPLGNPPSKQPILRMLKQARAFGVGQVLVTQNPVDVDYKGLSNAGSWFIGKLQTEQDKQRLLDGLQGVVGGSLDRSRYDQLISRLGKRMFLLHNIHNKEPVLFQTRWALNYLPGPLTRTQIPALNRLSQGEATMGVEPSAPVRPVENRPQGAPHIEAQPAKPASSLFSAYSSTRPALPAGVAEYFLPANCSFTRAFSLAGRPVPQQAELDGMVLRPVLLAQAHVRYLNRKYNLDLVDSRTALVPDPDRRGVVRWEDYLTAAIDSPRLESQPDPRARFAAPQAPLTDARLMSTLQKDFLDWAYRTGRVSVRANEALKLYAGPDTSAAEFRQLAAEHARRGRDEEAAKLAATFDRKIESLQAKLAREERELAEDQEELSQRKMEEWGTHAENLFGLFGGRKSGRRISTSLGKRRMTARAKAEVEESLDVIKEYRKQIAALESEKAQALEEVSQRWGEIANQITEISVTPYKKDVLIDLFGVAWMPVYLARLGDEQIELPAYVHE